MAKSPRLARLWLSPLVIKMFARVPARAIYSFYQVTPPSSVVLSFRHSQRFSCQDPGGGWSWHSAPHTRGVEERLSTQCSLCPCPLTWSLSYRVWSGLRPALPCQVDLISSEAEKGVRKIRGIGRVCFPHLFLRCPSWDKTTLPKKRHTHFALEVMLK